ALHPRWYELLVGAGLIALAIWDFVSRGASSLANPHVRIEVGIAAVLIYSSFHFYLAAQRRSSPAFYLLCLSMAFWAVLMLLGQYRPGLSEIFGVSGQLGPIPQMLLGIAMVMVLFENERNAVQENALAFSTLGVDPTRLLSAEDLVPSMQSILDRLVAPLPTGRAVISISERWPPILPSLPRGCSPAFLQNIP